MKCLKWMKIETFNILDISSRKSQNGNLISEYLRGLESCFTENHLNLG